MYLSCACICHLHVHVSIDCSEPYFLDEPSSRSCALGPYSPLTVKSNVDLRTTDGHWNTITKRWSHRLPFSKEQWSDALYIYFCHFLRAQYSIPYLWLYLEAANSSLFEFEIAGCLKAAITTSRPLVLSLTKSCLWNRGRVRPFYYWNCQATLCIASPPG